MYGGKTLYYSTYMARKRPKLKTATMTLRVDPRVKAVAEVAAEEDHRSLTSLVEVLILNHCKAIGIEFPPSEHKERSE